MALDAQARAIVDLIVQSGLAVDGTGDPVAVRARMESFAAAGRATVEDVHHVEDRLIPGPEAEIPIRVYRPRDANGLPTLVYLHGGGWVLCSLDTHDGTCRSFAVALDAVVVSVGYRRAPEHRFPAAVMDCDAATGWTSEHATELGGDPARLAIAGDSAGGNLAAVTAILARDRGGPDLAGQLLVYPVTDYEFTSPSMEENATGYFLEREGMRWLFHHYLRDESDAADWRVSPLRAPDLSRLPPTMVITAEHDPLRDQGIAYAQRLAAAGVPIESKCYPGMFHGFFGMKDVLDVGREAFEDAVKALRRALGE